jgi:hypothetical protein
MSADAGVADMRPAPVPGPRHRNHGVFELGRSVGQAVANVGELAITLAYEARFARRRVKNAYPTPTPWPAHHGVDAVWPMIGETTKCEHSGGNCADSAREEYDADQDTGSRSVAAASANPSRVTLPRKAAVRWHAKQVHGGPRPAQLNVGLGRLRFASSSESPDRDAARCLRDPTRELFGAIRCPRMPTNRQDLGAKGERAVAEHVACPRCNRLRHLSRLPPNFQCADLICRFCGFLAQVKATTLPDGSTDLPKRVLGAAWGPQHEQIIAGIYHGLYIAGFSTKGRLASIDYVPSHILRNCPEVFEPRNPLSLTAKRAGWRGFNYNLDKLPAVGILRVYPAER